jgi:hypothetical protein
LGCSQWFYNSPHELNQLLTEGYFDPVRTHQVSRGDLVVAVYNKPGQPLEMATMIVVAGADSRDAHGAKVPIIVAPSGQAYREAPTTKSRKAA